MILLGTLAGLLVIDTGLLVIDAILLGTHVVLLVIDTILFGNLIGMLVTLILFLLKLILSFERNKGLSMIHKDSLVINECSSINHKYLPVSDALSF